MSYGMYQVEEEYRGTTLKVVRIVAFSEEAAIRSFAHLQGYDDPLIFNGFEDGSVRHISSKKTLIICRCIRRYDN